MAVGESLRTNSLSNNALYCNDKLGFLPAVRWLSYLVQALALSRCDKFDSGFDTETPLSWPAVDFDANPSYYPPETSQTGHRR